MQNQVIVLGTVHGKHLKEEAYSLEVLRELVRAIEPDLILVEIPPDRFPVAMEEFLEHGIITESRVKVFPEYVDVIFPLTKEMEFKIIPTAGWTKEMAENRRDALKRIREDESRAEEWNELEEAGKKADSLMKASGREYDPYWIHTDEYDEVAEVELSVYNRLFNEELGLGGWDNINKAHYSYIEQALEEYKGQGKRILITYGAGHKGWFLRQLRLRKDIELLELQPFLDKVISQ